MFSIVKIAGVVLGFWSAVSMAFVVVVERVLHGHEGGDEAEDFPLTVLAA